MYVGTFCEQGGWNVRNELLCSLREQLYQAFDNESRNKFRKKSRERLRADSILTLICEIEMVYIYFIIFIIYIKNAMSYIATKSHPGFSLCF